MGYLARNSSDVMLNEVGEIEQMLSGLRKKVGLAAAA